MDTNQATKIKPVKTQKCSFNLRSLPLSLRFRPEIMKLVLKMRHKIKKKTRLLNTMKKQLKDQVEFGTSICTFTQTENDLHQDTVNIRTIKEAICLNASTQTKELDHSKTEAITKETIEDTELKSAYSNLESTEDVASVKNGWSLNNENGKKEKSIAQQVTDAAQSAMQQSGMVYVQSAGMYYDYKTGYYYSAELGLYYHPDTGCYYHYSEDKKTFQFHSYPDQSKTTYGLHEKKKARKLRKARHREEIDNMTKNLAQVSHRGKVSILLQEKQEENEQGSKAKRRKKNKEKIKNEDKKDQAKVETDAIEIADGKDNAIDEVKDDKVDKNEKVCEDLEDGECSESENVSTVSDNDGK